MFGIDLPLWAILLILAALALAVFAILSWLNAKVQAAVSGTGGTPPAPPPAAYAATLARVQTLINKLNEQQRPPTDDECRELRDALAQARAEGVPDSLVAPMQSAIDQLCN